jgi:hypothetical protein
MAYRVIAASMQAADHKKMVHQYGEKIEDTDIPNGEVNKFLKAKFIATEEDWENLQNKIKTDEEKRAKEKKVAEFDPVLLAKAAEFLKSQEAKEPKK